MDGEKIIHTDSPISEKLADTLGRSTFSEKMGKTINKYKGQDSLVIGIYGKWGDGKTSVINMILETIKNESINEKFKPIIIHFKPWYFSGQDRLLEEFFSQLAFQIQNTLSKIQDAAIDTVKQLGDNLIKFGKILRPIKYFAPAFGIPPQIVSMALNNVAELGESLSAIKNEENFDPNDVKEKISENLKTLNKKVIIVIDDIDRLTKIEIAQIFQLVKGLADFPNTIYLLSFDKGMVCEALSGVQTINASRYLEKIIQIPFDLPSISYKDLNKHLTSNLDKILGEDFNKQHQAYWASVYLTGLERYFTNLREINRFLNLFQFEYSLLQNEVNIVDLIVVTAIKSQDNHLYHFIRSHPEIFCGSSSSRNAIISRIVDEIKYKKGLSDCYKAKRGEFEKIDIIESVLKEIFPYFKMLMSDYNSGHDGNDKELKRSQRIANFDHFDRFFSLSVPEGQIPYMKLKEIIALQDNSVGFARAIGLCSQSVKNELIELFRIHLSEFKQNNILEVAKVVAQIAEDDLDDHKPYETSFSLKVRFFINELFKQENASISVLFDRYKALVDDNNIGPYMFLEFLISFANEIGAYNQGLILHEVVEKSEFKERFFGLENTLIIKLRALASEGKLCKHHRMLPLLYFWSRAKPDEPKAFVETMIKTDQGAVDFITALLSYSYGGEGRTSHVYKKNIDDFTNEVELVQKIRAIKEKDSYSELSDRSKEAIEALLRRIDNPTDWRH